MKSTLLKSARASLIFSLLMMVLLCAPLCTKAVAADDNSLTLRYVTDRQVMADVEFKLYRVATVNQEEITVTPIAPYDTYNVFAANSDWAAKAKALAGYVSRDKLTPTVTGTTNGSGVVRFDGLADGMYLITGQSLRLGNYTYTPAPFLLALPNTTDGYVWDSSITAEVKYTRQTNSRPDKKRDLRVLKVWDDEGHVEDRPESVTIDLLQDGDVYATVELNDGNNWRYDWRSLPDDAEYQVVEHPLGERYSVGVSEDGISFVVTNTYKEDTELDDPDTPLIDKPDDGDDDGDDDDDNTSDITIGDEDVPLSDLPNLPQTGQLWWPVPILLVAGILVLAMGVAVRRRSAWDDEE